MSPKARFFLRHLEWQRLPTNVLRFQRGTATSPICSRCGREQEAELHVLPDCMWAKAIWQQAGNSLCFALNTTSFPLPGWIGYTIISLIVMCSERIAVCL